MEKGEAFESVMVLSILLLVFALFVCVSAGPTGAGGGWNTSSVNATPYMFAGSGDRLYIFNVLWNDPQQGDTEITALGADGDQLWSYTVRMPWSAVNQYDRGPVAWLPDDGRPAQIYSWLEQGLVFATDRDTMYLYLRYVGNDWPDCTGEKVIAIRDGRMIWERPLTTDDSRLRQVEDAWVKVAGDRLYVYRSYNLSVFGTNGTLLFSIRNVSDPPSVDPDGNVYVTEVADGPEVMIGYEAGIGPQMMSLPMPSDRIASYGPDGALRWTMSADGTPVRQILDRKAAPDGCCLPLYDGGRLYVPLQRGMEAFDTGGRKLWNVSLEDNVSLLATMPLGPDGTAYLVPGRQQSYWSLPQTFYAIRPDGNVSVIRTDSPDMDLMGISQGVGYYGHAVVQEDSSQYVDRLLFVNLTAMDMRDGRIRWDLTIPPARVDAVIADRQNVVRLIGSAQGHNSIFYTEDHPDMPDRKDLCFLVEKSSQVSVVSGGNVVYVSYYLLNYEYPDGYGDAYSYTSLHNGYLSAYGYPALLGRSRICYASGIAAIGPDGSILWNRALDAMPASMAAGNGTVYFGTMDGGLSAVRTNAAVGFTVTAALYLFFRFFLVGAVARARSRIDGNVNRNKVLGLIRSQPGNTMYDIARLLGMNPGTVRYHLLILGMNHRIIAFQEGKYVRYFGNSGTLTAQEREIISLLRRDRARALLSALLEHGSLSNAELARALGVSEPAVSGYIKQLTGKGIVTRDASAGGSVRYAIRPEYREKIAEAIGR